MESRFPESWVSTNCTSVPFTILSLLLDAYTSTNPADWRVVLGEHHLRDEEVFEQSRGVEAIYLHPKYKSMFLEGIYDTPPDYDVG